LEINPQHAQSLQFVKELGQIPAARDAIEAARAAAEEAEVRADAVKIEPAPSEQAEPQTQAPQAASAAPVAAPAPVVVDSNVCHASRDGALLPDVAEIENPELVVRCDNLQTVIGSGERVMVRFNTGAEIAFANNYGNPKTVEEMLGNILPTLAVNPDIGSAPASGGPVVAAQYSDFAEPAAPGISQ
jgi:hypothetical protein